MSNRIPGTAPKTPSANNDNYHPALCAEVFTPGVGWSIHVDTGDIKTERLTLDDLIYRIYIIENGKRNKVYLDRAKDMRACLERIKSHGFLS